MTEEEWRWIPDLEGRYKISSSGLIRSELTHRVRKLHTNLQGYLQFNAALADGTCKTIRVHISVLEAFIGPRPNGMQACHNDGNKVNNNLTNLRWGTALENSADKIKHGTVVCLEKVNTAKINRQQALVIYNLCGIKSTYEVANDFNVTWDLVRRIWLGETWIRVTGGQHPNYRRYR